MTILNDIKWMKQALKQAKNAEKIGEVPVGAVIVYQNELVACGYNKQQKKALSISHAEIIAIINASKKRKSSNLSGCVMYVTLEPCLMCIGALINSRIKKLVYAAKNYFYEIPLDSFFSCEINIKSGILKEESIDLLENFFRNLRRINYYESK
ncbi:MAG: nucleoside deaminase [Deltaproteobacteria bacterium]|nr:MAG: nucleoside deaminase [Deltaproteobacteria bacterium]